MFSLKLSSSKLRVATIIAALLTASVCASGPDERSGTLRGIIEEVRVGRSCAARLAQKYGLVEDAGATRYLNQLANALGGVSTRQELTFYVGILNDGEANAMACPGGYLFITRGALKALGDESEAAFILGEQVAHVALRHMSGYTSGVASGDVESAVDGLLPMLTGGGLGSSRIRQSDEAALVYLATLGYDVGGAARALQKMNGAAYVSAHPSAADRASALQAVQSQNGIRSGGQTNQSRYAGSVGRL
ncbi:MAG: M48 family metalloprotease [Leptospirales bacterium]|nr:M48 family metalloprotease [Leptospirales bacterium]